MSLLPGKYANVLLPLPIPGFFTYAIPPEMESTLIAGVRVVVQFGRKKLYTALVHSIHETNPGLSVKEILVQMDMLPIVNIRQFVFWEWLSEYYMCSMGEVMNAALPPALKLSSESRISLDPDFDRDYSRFNEREYNVITVLEQQKELSISDVSQITEQQRVIPLINSLIEKKAVRIYEDMIQRYTSKTEKFYNLAQIYRDDENALAAIIEYLERRAPRQYEILINLLHYLDLRNHPENGIPKSLLISEIKSADGALRSLVEKGLLEVTEQNVSRLDKHEAVQSVSDIELTEHQQEAFTKIREHFTNQKPVLLHGITSSGKTEIYIKLIEETLKAGFQVLYLLPEIALTTQIISRLRKFFGDVAGVYHSRFGESERAEVWNKVASWQAAAGGQAVSHSVILGARSAIFLPFSKLGLIIIDEEHDTSYKQYDPSPRYNARDAAIYLAKQHNAKVLLGSATPAIESYFNAKTGKYVLVSLEKRYGNMMLPEISVVNLKEATRLKQMKSHFTPALINELEKALERNEQVILFQNRRGFALRLECNLCHYMPQCRHCDVTLIYHKKENHLRCHYCGYKEPIPPHCPKCHNKELNLIGFGTEKIEEELSLIYPDIRIARMDIDTTRSKFAHQRIITDFEIGKTDVLTGTQMVSKGLDFDNVSLVGILSADNMISFPDFRSFERSYQLMAQVSGRAGRKNKQGKVIIQTRNPKHPVINFVIENNYEGMYRHQIAERQIFNYPPFSRLLKISLKHKEPEPLNLAAYELAGKLKKVFPKQVLGPEYPVVSRIKNYFIKEILIKLSRDKNLARNKEHISEIIKDFMKTTSNKQIRVITDVDPM